MSIDYSTFSREKIVEWIASQSLASSSFNDITELHQVLDNGIVVMGSNEGEPIIQYKSDVLSLAGIDPHDFNQITGNLTSVITNIQNGTYDFNDEVPGQMSNPPNVSQFVGFNTEQPNIDPDKLNEVLDTEITELIPQLPSRQEEINNLFNNYNQLKPQSLPPYCTSDNSANPEGIVTLDIDGECTGITYASWAIANNISIAFDNNGDVTNSSVTRLDSEANSNNDTDGTGENDMKTLESLRNNIDGYLQDIDNNAEISLEDDRPEYTHSSQGYLQIRNLNQSVIIRRGEGGQVGIDKSIEMNLGIPIPELTNSDLANTYGTSGELTPTQLWSSALGYSGNPVDGQTFPAYLYEGFTVTMWVKFLDKVNKGTLFNFGNPFRLNDPHGFSLETFVVNRDEAIANNISIPTILPDGTVPYETSDVERFVKLSLRQGDDSLKDSQFGWNDGTTSYMNMGAENVTNPFQYTHIPVKLDEWYFIVASFNPFNDDNWQNLDNYSYWQGNGIDGNTHKSGYGSKCKVEVISKTDLLRARGYKPVNK